MDDETLALARGLSQVALFWAPSESSFALPGYARQFIFPAGELKQSASTAHGHMCILSNRAFLPGWVRGPFSCEATMYRTCLRWFPA